MQKTTIRTGGILNLLERKIAPKKITPEKSVTMVWGSITLPKEFVFCCPRCGLDCSNIHEGECMLELVTEPSPGKDIDLVYLRTSCRKCGCHNKTPALKC